MAKPRAPSDPSPSTGTENVYNSQTFTLPARVPHNQRSAEPFPTISASMILGMDVSHSGWVRKEGFGYRSWKSRFMVLHHGCLYYFKETDSNAPKGKFSLNGYRCYPAPDREKADRYPYVFKLVPDDERRVYYISSPSKIEMEGWMNSITTDIQQYCPSEYDYVETCEVGKSATCPTIPKKMPVVQQRTPGGRYVANSDKTFSHSFPKSSAMEKSTPFCPPKLYGGLEQDQHQEPDDQDFYETVDPLSFGEDHYLPVISVDETDSANSSSTAKLNICKLPNPTNGRPAPPVRPKPPPRPPDMHEDSESDGEDSDEDAWYVPVKTNKVATLRFQSPSSPRKNGLSPTSPERECPLPSPPEQNGADRPLSQEIDVTYLPVIGNKEFEDILKERNPESAQTSEQNQPKCPPRPSPKPPPRNRRPSEDNREFDCLPPDCFKPELPKQQAKIFLELGRTVGEYMINASQSSDTKMSLSVWLGNGVKHYLIFKRQEMYTLDPSLTDEHFTGLNDLVRYYYKHPLPKSGRYLTVPFSSQCLKSH